MLVATLALFVSGCTAQRPPSVMQANSFKRDVLRQAIADKVVRDQAYRQVVYEQVSDQIEADLQKTLAVNAEVAADGQVYVRGLDKDGKEVREPLAAFIRRAIALADANRQKVVHAVAAETAADQVVNDKLAAVAELDAAIERYQVAAESGALPQDLDKTLDDILASIKPLLK
ncbi:MAG: hypothetical protein ABIH03_02140 [Pseudomonadota bacterium]